MSHYTEHEECTDHEHGAERATTSGPIPSWLAATIDAGGAATVNAPSIDAPTTSAPAVPTYVAAAPIIGRMLHNAATFASKDACREALTYVAATIAEQGIRLMATDSYQLVVTTRGVVDAAASPIMLDGDAVRAAAKVLMSTTNRSAVATISAAGRVVVGGAAFDLAALGEAAAYPRTDSLTRGTIIDGTPWSAERNGRIGHVTLSAALVAKVAAVKCLDTRDTANLTLMSAGPAETVDHAADAKRYGRYAAEIDHEQQTRPVVWSVRNYGDGASLYVLHMPIRVS